MVDLRASDIRRETAREDLGCLGVGEMRGYVVLCRVLEDAGLEG